MLGTKTIARAERTLIANAPAKNTLSIGRDRPRCASYKEPERTKVVRQVEHRFARFGAQIDRFNDSRDYVCV